MTTFARMPAAVIRLFGSRTAHKEQFLVAVDTLLEGHMLANGAVH